MVVCDRGGGEAGGGNEFVWWKGEKRCQAGEKQKVLSE